MEGADEVCQLLLAAKGLVGVQGCLQLRDTFIILSYLEQMTNVSIWLAFTCLISEDWAPAFRTYLINDSIAAVLAAQVVTAMYSVALGLLMPTPFCLSF